MKKLIMPSGVMYKCRWKGYTEKDDTLEPLRNLSAGASKLVKV